MFLPWLLNTAWLWKCRAERRAFMRATRNVREAQTEVLLEILSQHRQSEFGKEHQFGKVRSLEDLQRCVPLSNYEDYADAIRAIGGGQDNILTGKPVRLFQPTSGSAGPEKLIPYGDQLRCQFQRAVAVWIGDLFENRPAVRAGRAYWSISPAFGPRRFTKAGIPIGFENDAAYLGTLERWALRRLLVTPSEAARLPDLNYFRYYTLLCLLSAADLSLISVWNPTFLTTLISTLPDWQDRLCIDLKRGKIGLPRPRGLKQPPPLRAHPRRASAIAAILKSSDSLSNKLAQIWPRLAIISCWTDAAAGRYVDEVRSLFPNVEIQPKGLTATEGVVSIPLVNAAAPALALRSHVFEFEEIAAGTSPRFRFADELETGGRYRVVITTGGGLYRYQLRDEVEVVGCLHRCPLLKFLGKSDRVCDLVGEKLTEAFVQSTLEKVFGEFSLKPRFALVVPVDEKPSRYRLYVQTENQGAVSEEFSAKLEAALSENPHYRYAVGLGQLGPIEISLLDPQGPSGWSIYERRCVARGMKVGDIKPVALDPALDWPREFAPLEMKPAELVGQR